MEWIYPLILGGFGAVLGLTFADIDLAPPLPLKHRSAWTHGPLVPFAAPFVIGAYPALWPFVICFLVTYGLHLVADMFPRMWQGSALINLYPLHLSLPPLLSFVWLAVGVGYTYYTWLLLLDLPTDWLWPR